MSLKAEWLKQGLRVLTKDGKGKLFTWESTRTCEVELDEPIAGARKVHYETGEVVLESDFTLIRVINTGFSTERLLVNAQNYPSWKEILEGLAQPFSQDETLVALDFQKKKFQSNRPFGMPDNPYHLIEVYFDMYSPMKVKVYTTEREAREAWEEIEKLSGTSGHLLLCVLINLETSQILAKALFATLKVVTKEVY